LVAIKTLLGRDPCVHANTAIGMIDAILKEHTAAQPAPVQEVRLWDTQWVSVVNHDNAYRGWDKQDAINHAVKMTEQYIAKNVLENKCPPAAQRQWTGLTDEAIWSEYQTLWPFHPAEEPRLAKDIAKFARAIEAKLRSKNI
jgi:hypothetical protein